MGVSRQGRLVVPLWSDAAQLERRRNRERLRIQSLIRDLEQQVAERQALESRLAAFTSRQAQIGTMPLPASLESAQGLLKELVRDATIPLLTEAPEFAVIRFFTERSTAGASTLEPLIETATMALPFDETTQDFFFEAAVFLHEHDRPEAARQIFVRFQQAGRPDFRGLQSRLAAPSTAREASPER